MKNPFPSSPGRPARYVFYCYHKDANLLGVGFCEMFAARKFLLEVVGRERYRWVSSREIVCDNGMRVQCEELEDIVEYHPLPSEASWILPEPYTSLVHVLRTGEEPKLVRSLAREEADVLIKQKKERDSAVSAHPPRASRKTNKKRKIKKVGG